MQQMTRQHPRRGQILPENEHSEGIEGFNYDWFSTPRKAPTRRRIPLAHYAAFAVIFTSLCLATYADLGPHGYQKRVDRLLNSHGLEWVAGQVMSLDLWLEQAGEGVLSMLGKLEPGSA